MGVREDEIDNAVDGLRENTTSRHVSQNNTFCPYQLGTDARREWEKEHQKKTTPT